MQWFSKKERGQWLIVGAGGVGRTLIAPVAQAAGFSLIFIDVSRELCLFLKERRRYTVQLAKTGRDQHEDIVVEDFSVINPVDDQRKFFSILNDTKTTVMSTSVRRENLAKFAPLLATALKQRSSLLPRLPILTCENIIAGGGYVEELVRQNGGPVERGIFPDVLVDCIVPQQPLLIPTVFRDAYGEIWVQKKDTAEEEVLSNIQHLTILDDIRPYAERKIIVLNGLHVAVALLGEALRLPTIDVAVSDARLQHLYAGLKREVASGLSTFLPRFSHENIVHYFDDVVRRFANPRLADTVDRILRDLATKLQGDGRIGKPALALKDPVYLSFILALGVLHLQKTESELRRETAETILTKTLSFPSDAVQLIQRTKGHIEELKRRSVEQVLVDIIQ